MGVELPPLVILCGGKSERMGTPKGLLEFHGRTWLEEQIARFTSAGGREVFVGLGHHDERYAALLAGAGPAVHPVLNPAPERGPFSTLWTTLHGVAAGQDVFVLPVDVPLVPDVLPLLAATGAYAVIPTHADRGGHPVLLSAEAVRDVLSEDPATQRLDVFLRARADRVQRLPADHPDVTLNLNTPERWAEYVMGRATA